MGNAYDIFISYRRDGGAQYARILQLMLSQRGYRVFLDYDELKDGVFGKRIKAAIKAAPVFMLVLSKDSLDRCKNENDWVREEILYAIEHQKKIVPVNPDKAFDGIHEAIPEAICSITDIQNSEIDFGQALGVTVDLMISNRLEPVFGKRFANSRKDEDINAAKITVCWRLNIRCCYGNGFVSAILATLVTKRVCRTREGYAGRTTNRTRAEIQGLRIGTQSAPVTPTNEHH